MFQHAAETTPNDDLGRPNKKRARVRFESMRAVHEKRHEFMLPKRKFWKEEQEMKCGFRRKHFSIVRSPNRVLTPFKGAFKVRISSFVPPLCSPNEEFGRPNKHFRTRFPSTFQRFVAEILYSTLKSASKMRSEMFVRPSKLFVWEGYPSKIFVWVGILPKSSFGWGRVISLANAFSHHTTCPGRPQTHETI
jgi:hypothetical protein